MYIDFCTHKVYTFIMKKRLLKKTILCILFLFSSLWSLLALPFDNIKEYTLENGLTVFVLQDTSTPLIRIEYTARAGFSNQTKETSGFFKLYTRIFEKSFNGQLEYAECNADSSRYCITTVPSRLQETLSAMAQTAFSPVYSDSILASELSQLKKETAEEAAGAGGLINAAIDSRVFSAYPWKHDSGVYPALFNKTTPSKARNILAAIGERWYTPQNSAVFISGNINENTILALLQETMGNYYSSGKTPASRSSTPVNNHRKFVLHNPELSADMTQIVMQFTVLNIEEAELLANMLNNNASTFKQKLADLPELAILGNEYIDVSAAHKKGSSRLIIQSLLQKPEDKKYKDITSTEQAALFVSTAIQAINDSFPQEFIFAQQNAMLNLSFINSSSTSFMSSLASYWAMFPYDSYTEEAMDYAKGSPTAANLFYRNQKFVQLEQPAINEKLSAEEPFIFVIINSNDYKKNKKAYTSQGYEEINSKNAAWYNQKIFADYKDPEQDDFYLSLYQSAAETPSDYSNDFYTENLKSIKKAALTNGIPLITKYNENSSDITIMLSIKGGKLKSADDNGFEEVLLSLLTTNIQKQITAQQTNGIILGNPEADYYCSLQTGTILVECAPYDFPAVCRAMSDAIIYSDILPAHADRAIAGRQYKKRLENGTVSFQMTSAIMKDLYPKSGYPKIFEAKKDILTKTSYQKILEGYPELLDADRYSIIVTGLFPDNTQALLESTMGLLTSRKDTPIYSTVQSKLKTGSTKKTVKVTHTFLTDIPAEKAGPMPAKLIPTKKFLDPIIYVYQIPQAGTKEHTLTLALMKYIEKLVQQQIDSNGKLKEAKALANDYYTGTDIITFTIQNVAEQKEADACFSAAITKLNKLLNSEDQNKTVQQIKDSWIEYYMNLTLTNSGTAMLLQKGLEHNPMEGNAEYYLEEFKIVSDAGRDDFVNLLQNIPAQAPLRYYAKN